jgi:hypothetical protein
VNRIVKSRNGEVQGISLGSANGKVKEFDLHTATPVLAIIP